MKIKLSAGRLTLSELAEICRGKLLGQDRTFSEVCTDSREAGEQTLFLALRGEVTDGHRYIGAARDNGCSCVLCEEDTGVPGVSLVIVPDVGKALLAFAGNTFSTFGGRTVAVTGSVGKTTTKEMIASVLGRHGTVVKTEENHNSLLGLPMSLLQMSRGADYAVLEMGMSGLGEIGAMSRVGRPDLAVITNIGSSHLELLGSRENIARAKLEITEGMKPGGVLVLNGDEPLLRGIDAHGVTLRYASLLDREADYFAEAVAAEGNGTVLDLTLGGRSIRGVYVPLLGAPALWSALYGAAIGDVSDLSEKEIREGLAGYVRTGMRQNIFEKSGITIIEDCYNASPESVRASLEVLAELPGKQRRAAVLADMLELGPRGRDLHRQVGAAAARFLDLLITFGPLAKEIARGAIEAGMPAQKVRAFEDLSDPGAVAAFLKTELASGDCLLLKGSRATGTERISALLN